MTARRDDAIERLLHEARSSAETRPGECPDAETLGAFADGTLRTATRRDIEAHIADCHRCQMVTASMVNVESTLGAWPDEVAAKGPWWRARARDWMVPAAVGVTAGALWLAVVDQRTPSLAPVPDGQNEPAAGYAAAPPAPDGAQALQDADTLGNARVADETAERFRSEATKPSAPPAPQRAAAAPKAEESLPSLQRAIPAAPASEPVTVTREGRLDQAVSSPPSARQESADSRQSVQERQTAQENESDRAPAQTAERPSAAPPLAGAASARGITAQGRDASALEIPSPDPQVRWRVVPGTAVQRSSDRGATWATQQTGVTTELTAGSAPAADVCWLVGRGGVVLRTTSAGRAWQRVRFPEPVDLTAVTATSALDATASLVDGRRFRTTDGGATWAPAP